MIYHNIPNPHTDIEKLKTWKEIDGLIDWPQNSQGGVNKSMSRVMISQKVGGLPGTPGVSLNCLYTNVLNIF